MNDLIRRAYENVLNTKDGQLVFEDLLSKFQISTGVYKFEGNDSLSDLAYRDGQRNCGIYIYSILCSINPENASLINTNIHKAQNDLVKQSENTKGKDHE